MLQQSRDLIEAGGAIVVLRPRDKRPLHEDWTQRPRWTWDEAEKHFPEGSNVGVRLGEPSRIDGRYLFGIDLDIRSTDPKDIDDAWDRLSDFIGDHARFSSVRSGSGGESRHLYALCDEPIRTRKLAHSENKLLGRDGKQHWAWEIDLGGTGRQFVLPPSIHPITRRPYEWDQKIAWADLPVIRAEDVRSWLPADRATSPVVDTAGLSELAAWWRDQPGRFGKSEIEQILDTLSRNRTTHGRYVEDREGWLSVGMALHHQAEGEEWGFELWCAFSGDSDKFDAEDSWRVWRSFGKTAGARSPLTMKSLKRYADTVDLGEAIGALSDGDRTEMLPDDFGARSASRERASRVDLSDLLDGPGDSTPDPDPELWEEALRKLCAQQARDRRSDEEQWLRDLDRNDDGRVKATFHNVGLIVEHDDRLKGLAQKNLFTGETVRMRSMKPLSDNIVRRPLHDPINGDLWSDIDDTTIRFFLAAPSSVGRDSQRGYGMKVSKMDIGDAVLKVAERNTFHPIRDYLKRLRWDGVVRVDSLFVDYLGTPNDPYFRDTALLMMIGAVARIWEPGHKFDSAVILEGPEGLRKSSFVRALAVNDAWFGELHGDVTDRKAMVEQMQGKWLLELPELTGFNRAEVNNVKAFMSGTTDNVRLAYARRSVVFPRQCVFVGSTNDQQYLRSETGNRRFFPVPVSKDIDTTRLRRNIGQLWAEAFFLYKAFRAKHPAAAGPLPLFLRSEASAASALQIQAERKVESVADILRGPIEHFVNEPDTIANITGVAADKFSDTHAGYLRAKVCAASIHRDMPGLFGNRPLTPHDLANVNLVMKNLGWHSAPLRFGSLGQQRGWKRPKANEVALRTGYVSIDQK